MTSRLGFVGNFTQDLRYAIRVLAAQPLLLVAATTSIALGVGANLTIFGLANNLLLSTPTATDVDELIHIRTRNGSHVAYTAWRDFEESGALAGIAGYQIEAAVNWRGRDSSITVTPLIVTANFFEVVGVPIARGRGFTSVEAAAEREPRLAVLGHGFWTRRLGADPAVIGRPITFNGERYTVIGVLPAEFRSLPGYGIVPDVILPVTKALMPDMDRPKAANVMLVGRLKPDQTVENARATLATVATRLGASYADRDLAVITIVAPVGGLEQLREVREIAAFFGVLLVVTTLVLTIACANVAGLLLARGAARRKEIALRLAIGASRRRLVQQLLTEGLVLSIAGTAVGLVLVAVAGVGLSRIALPLSLPIEFHLIFDARLAWLATALVITSTVLCGLAPALQSTKPALVPALKQEIPAYMPRRFTLRGLLVAGQVAVSVLLLVMTVLFLRNLALARGLAPGFDAAETLVVQLTFVEGRQGTERSPAVATITERLRALPGIEAATFAEGIPLALRSGWVTGTNLRIEGRDRPLRVDYFGNMVGPGYFETMGIPLIRGRDFALSDGIGAPMVIVINQEFARRYFEGDDPIGRHVFLPILDKEIPALVIGIAGDSKYRTIGEDHEPAMYEAYLQRGAGERFAHVIARTAGPPESLTRVVETAVTAIDDSAAISVEPMTSALKFAFLPTRIGAVLVGALGTLGALLASVGLYGVISFAVSRRTAEIGIRMALGATRGAVVRLVLRDGALLVAAGVLTGLAMALVLTAPLRAFLVTGLETTDPVSFSITALLMVVTSLLATWGPARRATRIEPTTALRAE